MIPVNKSGDIKVQGGYITQADYVKIHRRADEILYQRLNQILGKEKLLK